MQGVQRRPITSFEDCKRAFDNVWLLLEKLDIYVGNGSPENVVTAGFGAIYINKDGGADTSIYVKETDNDRNSGWVAK